MEVEIFERWMRAWSSVEYVAASPLLGPADELLTRSFTMFARAAAEANSELIRSVDALSLARDCMLISAPFCSARPGYVKSIGFSTRGDQLDRLLLGLVVTVLMARQSDHAGPVAWISFPAFLLDQTYFERIHAAFSIIERIPGRLGDCIDVSYEPADHTDDKKLPTRAPPVYIGTTYPFRDGMSQWRPDSFDVQNGLPLICIPSRATEGTTIGVAPTPLAGALPSGRSSRSAQ